MEKADRARARVSETWHAVHRAHKKRSEPRDVFRKRYQMCCQLAELAAYLIPLARSRCAEPACAGALERRRDQARPGRKRAAYPNCFDLGAGQKSCAEDSLACWPKTRHPSTLGEGEGGGEGEESDKEGKIDEWRSCPLNPPTPPKK